MLTYFGDNPSKSTTKVAKQTHDTGKFGWPHAKLDDIFTNIPINISIQRLDIGHSRRVELCGFMLNSNAEETFYGRGIKTSLQNYKFP